MQIRALPYGEYWTAATVLFQGPYQLDFSDWSFGEPNQPGPWSGFVYGVPGTLSGATPADGDLDGDADVDLTDLALLLAAFGTTCV